MSFGQVSTAEDGGSGSGVQTVNARDPHAFVQVGKCCATWIKDRIQHFGFVEGGDYVTETCLRSLVSGSTKAHAQTAIEHHLSLDMSKELATMAPNFLSPQNLPDALRLTADLADQLTTKFW
ncbi:antA/AntB antirepressor family protein [Herbaspirillum frisingense]|uniref:antA/AntB antirepressor family protein n=1 Tax=Herbaspirillum frisingense TaxID=92645 RepID=UPI00398C44E6|nr:antA/AntB antirepressor family protein [Herbaspirillum frisingense]